MRHTSFGNTGFSVSALGFGAAPIGLLDTEQERVSTILNLLLDRGVNLIDTAAMYEGSEELIAKAVGHRRDEFVLVTKCGTKVPGVEGEEWSEQLITQSVDRALQRLKTDRLDVMLLHTCDKSVLERGEALGALVAAREAGKIRFVGYSGDNEAVAYAATLPDVAVVETSINICDQVNIDTLLPIARERNLGVLAKRPVANTVWKSPDKQPGLYRAYSAQYAQRFESMGLTPEALG